MSAIMLMIVGTCLENRMLHKKVYDGFWRGFLIPIKDHFLNFETPAPAKKNVTLKSKPFQIVSIEGIDRALDLPHKSAYASFWLGFLTGAVIIFRILKRQHLLKNRNFEK